MLLCFHFCSLGNFITQWGTAVLMPLLMCTATSLPILSELHLSKSRITSQHLWVYSENKYIYSLLGHLKFVKKYLFEPKTCRRWAIILILNSTIIFISQMFCADRKAWAIWICQLGLITTHLESLMMLVPVQWLKWVKKKNFILFFPYERATGFAMHFFLKKEKVPLKWRILKMVLEALEKTRNSF